MGAATAGVRFTGDFEGFASRSKETADGLERLEAEYEYAEDRVDFDLTAETLAATARVMTGAIQTDAITRYGAVIFVGCCHWRRRSWVGRGLSNRRSSRR